MGSAGASAPIRVLAWPGFGARAKNPYTWLLYSHLAKLGVQVRDFTPAGALRGGYDLLHVHWPEKALMMQGNGARFAGAITGRVIFEAARLHGARVVWTTHNAHPHEDRGALQRWYWNAFVRRVDGLIHPSDASRAMIEAAWPQLAARPQAVVRLGAFRGSYPDRVTREEARASFGVPDEAAVIAFLGLVRPYKNVPHLMETARALPPDRRPYLLVGGEPMDHRVAAEVERAAAGDPRVRLDLRHVPDEDVQRYLRAADLVVLPFSDITNSGSALLALSFDRPVLVPRLGAMGELQALVGADWVRTYDGELTPAVLDDAITWAGARPRGVPDLSALDWAEIARQTLDLYRRVICGGGVSGAGSSPNR